MNLITALYIETSNDKFSIQLTVSNYSGQQNPHDYH